MVRVDVLPMSNVSTARNQEILRREETGESHRSIAMDMNLSSQRIDQIVKRLTLSQRAGPGAPPLGKAKVTPRERQVALLVERNLSYDEIARQLGIAHGTVKNHVHNILIKGGLSLRPRRLLTGAKTAAGIERIRAAQRRRWQRTRAARSDDNT
jgi:DNA-binding NarL/FixJ family response regulator